MDFVLYKVQCGDQLVFWLIVFVLEMVGQVNDFFGNIEFEQRLFLGGYFVLVMEIVDLQGWVLIDLDWGFVFVVDRVLFLGIEL